MVLCLGCVSLYAQHIPRQYPNYSKSSGFVLDSLDARNPQVVDNLATLCRVWGYAKYHHPIFADSTVNIDYELFALLPEVVHADRAARNKVLYDWVKGLGEYTPNKPMYDEALAGVEHWSTLDLGWTADTVRLGSALSALLQDLRYAERGENRYVLPAEWVEGFGWQPVRFTNEASYNTITKFESGYCLLALFRYWNIIEYFAPNMPKTDKPWSDVLTEYISRMGVDAGDLKTFQQDYMSLIHEMNDGHAFFPVQDYYFGTRTLPIWTQFLDGKLIVTNPDQVAGLQLGDEIVSVDGMSVSDRLEDVRKYAAYSNDAGFRQALRYYPLRTRKEQSICRYRRSSKVDSLVINTVSYTEYSWTADPAKAAKGPFRLLRDSVGYIYPSDFTSAMFEDAMNLFRNTKAIIVDLRTYPRLEPGVISSLVYEHLLENPAADIQWSYPTLVIPGEYYLLSGSRIYRGVAGGAEPQDNPDAYNGKIVVLVDEMTQSAAETAAINLQACPETVVVGSQTAGTNGNLVLLPLTGGLMTGYSSIGCYYPDGYDIQRKGVRIDIEVRPTIDGIRAGRDEVLETALKIIE